MSYKYPPAAPTISGDVVSIDRFLNSPTAVARRLRTLLDQRYIADRLLVGRFSVEGGAVQYETGESIFPADNPEAVQPLAGYPKTTLAGGTASIAKTVKWGRDAEVSDEAIKRQRIQPVNRGMVKLANGSVKYVDSVALSAIASAVTASTNAAADWSTATAKQILDDAAQAKANIVALNEGYMPDTVVVDDVNWAYAMTAFIAAGIVPRESKDTPAVTGKFPTILGMEWLPTPNVPVANTAIVLDSQQLGGMADEDLGGPGYVKVNGVGVETKVIRDDDKDGYKIRARRVTVPIVLEPAAARKIAAI